MLCLLGGLHGDKLYFHDVMMLRGCVGIRCCAGGSGRTCRWSCGAWTAVARDVVSGGGGEGQCCVVMAGPARFSSSPLVVSHHSSPAARGVLPVWCS